jgi:hypothetical protein
MDFELDAAWVSKQGIVAQHKGKRSSASLQPITAVDVTECLVILLIPINTPVARNELG